MAYYERLSAVDAAFLGIEDSCAPMHVGSVMLFDAAPLQLPDGILDIERIRLAVLSRLHLVPRFRQRLQFVPYDRSWIWVDDHRFRLAYHVRHSALPRPGDERQLKRLVGRIMSQPLDRGRPLWELWFVEGVAGNQVALISKTHHCMVDGISGADLMSVMLQPRPASDPGEPVPWVPRSRPSRAELLAAAIGRRLALPLQAGAAAIEVLRNPRTATAKALQAARAVGQALAPALRPASRTPSNVDIGPHRRFDWTRMAVADFKAVKNALGGTVNDVVLATVSGALRRFFAKRGQDPNCLQVKALVPVSVRKPDERGTLGNRVTEMIAPLPVHLPDPVARLEAVRATMSNLKESKMALGGEVLTAIAEWAVPNLLVQAVRLAERARPYNLIVTNVPGPQIPLYFLGSEMRTAYPVVPLFHDLGLVVGIFSYNGGMFWGFNADWEHIPDLHDFVEFIDQSFQELREAARKAAAGVAPRTAAPRRNRRGAAAAHRARP